MKGDVRMRIRGLMPEKLVERALETGVTFRRVQPGEDHAMWADVSARDARRLMKLCRRFSIPAEIVSRRGGSAAAQWLRRRWTLAAGALAMLAVCALLLTRVWRVDIEFTGDAADRGDAAGLLSALEAMGVRPGMDRRIDTARLAQELSAQSADYSYIGARVEGVRLVIEAAPEIAAPEVYDVDRPRNLYASCAGIVVSVVAESGEACVKPGDTVRAGQLLIRGAERVGKEDTRPIAAMGEVMIRAWFEGSAEGRLRAAQPRYTGRQSAASVLQTPWFDVPIVEATPFEHQSVETDVLPVGGLFIPVMLRRDTLRETRFEVETGDRELLSSRLTALAMADARTRLAAFGPVQYSIERSWIRYTQPSQDTLRASAVCEIYTNAAAPGGATQRGG